MLLMCEQTKITNPIGSIWIVKVLYTIWNLVLFAPCSGTMVETWWPILHRDALTSIRRWLPRQCSSMGISTVSYYIQQQQAWYSPDVLLCICMFRLGIILAFLFDMFLIKTSMLIFEIKLLWFAEQCVSYEIEWKYFVVLNLCRNAWLPNRFVKS